MSDTRSLDTAIAEALAAHGPDQWTAPAWCDCNQPWTPEHQAVAVRRAVCDWLREDTTYMAVARGVAKSRDWATNGQAAISHDGRVNVEFRDNAEEALAALLAYMEGRNP